MKKSTRWVILFLVLSFVFFLAIGLALGIFLFSRQGVIKGPRLLVFQVPTLLPETPPPPHLGTLFAPRPLTLFETTQAIRRAAEDKSISGALLKISFVGMGWGQIQELRDALAVFRQAGKPVFAYLEFADNREYYLAAIADHVFMPPETVARLGLNSEVTFFRRTLDKVKVEPQLEHVGDYKSASDIFMRDSMSEEHRASMNTLLDSIYGQLIHAIQENRSIESASAERIIDRGLLAPAQLLRGGFIDAVLYPDELADKIYDELQIDLDEPSDTLALREYAGRRELGIHFGRKIAVVVASGDIASGKSRSGGWIEVVGSETVGRQLREIRQDDSIAAVVLRINSPGGSGFASDLIWREVELTRQVKPVVVSMSDLAASGGYYIAMGADYVFAQPATLTGSIGVIAGKFVLKDLYDWAGMTIETLQRGDNAEIFSESHRFTDEQREILQTHLEQFYEGFVRKAAEGRGMTWEEMDNIAQGQVWTGELAKALGLVDELGGLQDAIDKAKELAHPPIPVSKKVPLVMYPREKSFFEQLAEMDEVHASVRNLPEPARAWMKEAARAEQFQNEALLLRMPFIPEIR